MKVTDGRISAFIGKAAKKRLADLQSELRFAGCKDRDTSPGRIVARLLLMDEALEYLKKRYSLEE